MEEVIRMASPFFVLFATGLKKGDHFEFFFLFRVFNFFEKLTFLAVGTRDEIARAISLGKPG